MRHMGILAAVLAVSGIGAVANAAVAVSSSGGFGTGWKNVDWTADSGLSSYRFGYYFTVGAQPITVTDVGVLSFRSYTQTVQFYQSGTIIGSMDTGLASAPVASATVAGAGAGSGFTFTDVPDFTLSANTTYYITTGNATRYMPGWDPAETLTVGPFITSTLAPYATPASHLYGGADHDGWRQSYSGIGANFMYSIPEPAALALAGIASLTLLRRRK